MNTHGEHGAIRSAGFLLFNNLTALIGARLKAWRAQRLERAQIAALEALGPEILDDIGVSIVTVGRQPKSMAACHPHLIAATALGASKPTKRDEP
ncbi:MAG: hypothetical protein AB7F09_18165 [Parvibaculaceae bacterium]